MKCSSYLGLTLPSSPLHQPPCVGCVPHSTWDIGSFVSTRRHSMSSPCHQASGSSPSSLHRHTQRWE